MRRFLVEWTETARFHCAVEVEASTPGEALEKFRDGDWADDEYQREEVSTKADPVGALDVKEVKEYGLLNPGIEMDGDE